MLLGNISGCDGRRFCGCSFKLWLGIAWSAWVLLLQFMEKRPVNDLQAAFLLLIQASTVVDFFGIQIMAE